MTEKTNIYITCQRCSGNNHYMEATDDEGIIIEEHISSNHEWGKLDMGINSDRKHDVYKEKCPNGYKLIWVDPFLPSWRK